MGYLDITGQRYGKLTAIERDVEKTKEKKKTYWIFRCDCGREKSARLDSVRAGRISSCGQCRNDYTNQRFGKLVALKKTKTDKFGHQFWLFQCDCGNQKEINIDSVKRGLTVSCGCFHSQETSQRGNDLIGKKFNKLTVIELVNINPRKYLCQCDCGGTVVVTSKNLISGHTKSCGCLISYGESIINNYLTSKNVNFIKEYSVVVPGLKRKGRFDFAIIEDNKVQCLIEFHGKQHYEETGLGNFEQRKQYDEYKMKWAQKNNIKLYIIPYWEINNIEKILDNIIKETANIENMSEDELGEL